LAGYVAGIVIRNPRENSQKNSRKDTLTKPTVEQCILLILETALKNVDGTEMAQNIVQSQSVVTTVKSPKFSLQ
jgi:hypothetical protein